jgi:hypothetical protein
MMAIRRSTARNSLRFEALLACRNGVLHATPVAGVHEDESARTVGQATLTLDGGDAVIDGAAHIEYHLGTLKWCTVFTGYNTGDAKHVIATSGVTE